MRQEGMDETTINEMRWDEMGRSSRTNEIELQYEMIKLDETRQEMRQINENHRMKNEDERG